MLLLYTKLMLSHSLSLSLCLTKSCYLVAICKNRWGANTLTWSLCWITLFNWGELLGRDVVTQLVTPSSRYSKGCGFNPRSGHIQETTNECINKWKNKNQCFSLSVYTKLINKCKKIITEILSFQHLFYSQVWNNWVWQTAGLSYP